MEYTYASCVSRAKAANWSLADFEDLTPDFTKEFMPESLAQTRALACLTEEEALRFNQIRGYTYAHIFGFLEEYIIDLVVALREEKQAEQNAVADEAFGLFVEEERKHQRLFEGYKEKVRAGFDADCGLIDGVDALRGILVSHSRLSTLLLTAMFEWLTQEHYLQFFEQERSGEALDPAFKQLFRLHWVEEAQHARLDSLEAVSEAESLGMGQRDAAIDELGELLRMVRIMLHQQADLDLVSLEAAIGRDLGAKEREEVRGTQEQAYVHAFIELALQGDKFRKLIEGIVPGGMARLEDWAEAA